MITVRFNGCRMATALQSLYQYDYNQELQILGLPNLPQVFTADFCNVGDAATVPILGENGVVGIPAQFAATGRDICVYVFWFDEATGGKTRGEILISVIPRAERTDEEPTPEQTSIIDQYIAALNAAVDAAETAITHYPTIASGTWRVWDVTAGAYVDTGVSAQGPTGATGATGATGPAGPGLPAGGTEGQVPVKDSSTDYDTKWKTLTQDDIGDGSTYKRATAAQLAQIATNTGDIAAINGKIPAAASSSNQLADKAYVTDSITQGTAAYRGSFASKAALLAVSWQTTDPSAAYYVSNNDYAVVLDDETHSDECWRYLYVTGTGWTAQYRINESPLTQAQLDALNSGATAAIIGSVADKLDKTGDGSNVTVAFTAASSRANISTGEKLSVLMGKIAKWLGDLGTAAFRAATNAITSGSTDLVESGAVYTGLAGKQAKITASGILKGDGNGGVSAATAGTDYGTYSKPSGGIPASDLASAVQTSLGKADTALQSAPVTSVNGQTGAVTLSIPTTPADIGAEPAVEVITVSGSTPSITAVAGKRYVCGECSTLTVAVPASGIIDVVFESGSTATVLTITPATGSTVSWANGFDPTSLDASTTYELNIMDGLGVAAKWT